MSFRMAKSQLKIDKVGGLGRPTGAIPVISGRVGGRGGGQQRLLESDRNCQESVESIPNPLLPARRAADDGKCALVYGGVLTLHAKVSTLNIFLLVLFFGRRGWARLGFKGDCGCNSALLFERFLRPLSCSELR